MDIFIPPTNTMTALLCEILLSVSYLTDGETEAESYSFERANKQDLDVHPVSVLGFSCFLLSTLDCFWET